MKMKLLVLAVTLSMLLSGMLVAVGADMREGNESVDERLEDVELREVQEIHDWHDLDEIRDGLNEDYVLMNDLDEETDGYGELVDTEDGWGPIRDEYLGFEGTFDGDGHEISGLYIDRSNTHHVGLFGSIGTGGEVHNVSVVDADVSGHSSVGVLAGSNEGTMNASHAAGEVIGDEDVGGLVGSNEGMIINSRAAGEMIGLRGVGGLVGDNLGTVENSHYDIDTVEINGDNHVTLGGLFDEQYQDWLDNDKDLDISDYSDTLVPSDDHYEISGPDGLRDLLGFSGREGYEFRLVSDIDLSDASGLYVPYLAAGFDGQDHVISDLHVDMSFATFVGMFGYVDDGGEVSDVGVVDAEMEGHSSVGILVGGNRGRVSDSYVTGAGEVEGQAVVGGLAGVNLEGTVTSSDSSVMVEGGNRIGGLIGENYGTITDSYATGDVQGENWVGGLVGSSPAPIRDSHATGNVSGNDLLGGLTGYSEFVSDSWASGDVDGVEDIGGLVGKSGGTVEDSYAVGTVEGDSNLGGLVGRNHKGEVIGSYSTGGVYGSTGQSDYDRVGGLVGYNYHGGLVSSTYSEAEVEGWFVVGGLVGSNKGTVEDSYAMGNGTGLYWVGGLVGYDWARVENSYAMGNVNGTLHIGGLIGLSDSETVENTYAKGNVDGGTYVGGLLGFNYAGPVSNSYALGEVDGDEEVGGLVGTNHRGTVSDSYALGEVDGDERVGGLVGQNRYGTVSNSYSVGSVDGDEEVGGLVGYNHRGTVGNSFWDTETSGIDVSDGGTGKTTAEMRDVATYTDLDTEGLEEPWDFVGDPNDDDGDEDIWDIDEGYPFLTEFGSIKFTLDVMLEGEGFVDIDPDKEEYEHGEAVDLIVDPDEGWYFEEWIGTDETGEEITITIDGDREVTARFEECATLTIDGITGEGTVTVDGEEVTDTPFEKYYKPGETADLLADPGEGWYFEDWVGLDGSEVEVTLTMDEDVTIDDVLFEEYATLIIEGVTGEGTVYVDGDEVTEAPFERDHEQGEEVELTASADEGWYFEDWVGLDGSEVEVTLTMDEDVTIDDVLFEEYIGLTVDGVTGEGTVYVDEEEVTEMPFERDYEQGEEVELTASADEGWYFVEWVGLDGSEVEVTLTMDEDVTIDDVLFEEYVGLTVDVEGEGAVEVDPEEDEYERGAEVELTASADEGWTFVEWGGDHVALGEAISVTMTDDKEITAHFEEEVEYYMLTVDVEGEGAVEVDPEEDEYEDGAVVTLEAVPDDDWEFDEWEGTDETGELIEITMDDDKEITAHFEEEEEDEIDMTMVVGIGVIVVIVVILAAIMAMKGGDEVEMEEEMTEEERRRVR